MNYLSKLFGKASIRLTSIRGLINLKRNKLITNAGDRFFIACFPKSGSTFLSKALANSMGYKYAFYFDEIGVVSQQALSEIKMVDTLSDNLVVHQHLTGSNENIEYLLRYKIKPVIIVRDLYDCLLSLREHMYKEGLDWPFMFHVDKCFYDLHFEEQINFLIDFAVPWYINFYSSWVTSIRIGKIEAFFLTYESLIKDKQGSINSILEFYGKAIDRHKIDFVISELERSKEIRFNQGKSKVGLDKFTTDQKNRIRKLTRYYPEIDFSLIGI